ncbi:hypothetical protein ASPWEDRAFT_187257 [Aspergillus wentii DTO 134E9]|uniref:Arginine metabolism regulation protein II n=1 Tax=Aspergillus wentii DTO 134E9 TaxID=1073089 RepID=A0A1L9R8X5_ASPWE|nr:uncharacterized protein ASPWEDRAFT_187257 [Aspergillus wentii DTO 134E9]OJJ31371.1 hypothetical protein ASPWEDRAFT_187257 [Aspergillus wentii DTO 134E9]
MPASSDENSSRRKQECDSAESLGIRHYMYTEHARRSMSNTTSNSLRDGSVDVSLREIDARSSDPGFTSKEQHAVGPFAVLNFSKPPDEPENEPENGAINPPGSDADGYAHLNGSNDGVSTTARLDVPCQDGLLQWSDLFNFNDDLYSLASDLFKDDQTALDLTCPQTYPPGDTIIEGSDPFQNIPATPQYPIVDLLKDAGLLLKHFHKAVTPQLTVVTPKKTPWEILNVPAAMETLGQLTALGSDGISHARLANFYSLQACSAIHLTGMAEPSSKDYWRRISDQAYTEAKHHMKLSLSKESEGPNKAKFKDQMMALYGVAECAIFSCQQRDARCYLMDAERLLRSRGLCKKRISRKVRLLVNVYTWLRIVGESTYVLHNYSSIESFVETMNERCRPRESIVRDINSGIRLDDFLLFEDVEHNLNIDEPKDRRVDIPDIHLQDSRKSSESLSYEVYGMSETWLSLVSQTTRLANVLDALRSAQDAELPVAHHVVAAVQRREVRLENVIQSFVARSCADSKHTHIIRALNSGLVILFYRRVRRVHPAILGGQVDKAIAALDAFYSSRDDECTPGPGTLWPAFMAGCEAITKVQREAIWKLIERGEAKGRTPPYRQLKDILSQAWVHQDERTGDCGQPLPTWMDTLRARQSWPVFA